MTAANSLVADLLILFVAVLGVAIAARYARVPYTVGLVIVGLAIGAFPGHPVVALTPDLIMFVFLPALLFAGAWTFPLAQLKKSWLPIALFATLGVLISIIVSRFVLVWGAGLSIQAALLFGAIVAATDPVAVLAIFRSLRTNEQLAAIVEGESLFNDATAVVAFKVTLLVTFFTMHVGVATPVVDFFELLLGGAAVGLVVGVAGLFVLRLTDDYLVEATGTLTIAYGSYFLAERVNASGIIAVIVSAMLLSGLGARVGSFTQTRQSVNHLWEFVAFLANSMLFLLVGLAINLSELANSLFAALWGIGAVALARVISVYGLSRVSALFGSRLPLRWQHLFFLGGLRGALSMALALSLPLSLPHRDVLIAMVFSAVLFTLLIQGLSIAPAIRHLDLSDQARPD